jgi:hypothetical protein
MARWLIRMVGWGAVAVSLLVFLLGAGMWGRSYWRVDWWRAWGEGDKEGYWTSRDVVIWSAKGGVGVYLSEYRGLPLSGPRLVYAADRSMEYPYVPIPQLTKAHGWRVGPVTWMDDRVGPGFVSSNGQRSVVWENQRDRAVVLPWWLFAAVGAVFPAIGCVRWRRGRRTRWRALRGLCVRCGYDLRASTGKCPECGTER